MGQAIHLHRVPLIVAVSVGTLGIGAGFAWAQAAASADAEAGRAADQAGTHLAGAEVPSAAGRAAYLQHCARCHGVAGHGDGRDAKRLYPRPRDFTSGTFKFRSTASGTAPTDDDLFNTITNGLTAGGMPDWRHLDERVRWQLVAYLKTLSTNFTDNPPQPLNFGHDLDRKHVNLAAGRHVYEKLGCASCHGANGRANGSSAAGFTDNWGMAIRPADLTQGWSYRGGGEPDAIVHRVLAGIDGSPMPSYAEAASTDEIWQLAHYVRSLQEEARWTMIVRVPYIAGPLPQTADDPRWAGVPRTDVRVRNTVTPDGQVAHPPTVTAVSFQALHDGKAVAFRIWWHDPSENRQTPGDALALAFEPAGLWGDVVTLQTWPLPSSPALDLYVWSPEQGAHETVATRYDDAFAGASSQAASASYQDGQWTLVLTRPLAPAGRAAAFAPGAFAPMALAVWDGGNASQRAVSQWIDLSFERSASEASASAKHAQPPFVWIITGIVVAIALVWAVLPRPRNQ